MDMALEIGSEENAAAYIAALREEWDGPLVVKGVQELVCLGQRLRGVSPHLAQGRVARSHQTS